TKGVKRSVTPEAFSAGTTAKTSSLYWLFQSAARAVPAPVTAAAAAAPIRRRRRFSMVDPRRQERRGGETRTPIRRGRIGVGGGRSARPLLAHVVDELEHVDDVLVVLVRDRDELLVLAVGQAVEIGLVLGRHLHERLLDRLLELGRQARQIGVGRAG